MYLIDLSTSGHFSLNFDLNQASSLEDYVVSKLLVVIIDEFMLSIL